MRGGLIATKLGMSSMFNDSGEVIPVTLLKVQDCQVVGHRTKERDGYTALIIGAANAKPSRVSKSMRTVFANAKVEPKVSVKEFRITEAAFLDVGTVLTSDFFKKGQFVDVAGVSIGKGFAGGMKRHNFRGLEASHGVSVSHRSIGSTGGCQDPGRVFKNKKMPGHLGDERVTIQNLQVVDTDVEGGLIMVKGAVPGSKGLVVYIKDAVKKMTAV